MIIVWIALLVLWIVLTEIIFFRYARNDYNLGSGFLEKKGLSAFCSFVLVMSTIGIPTFIAFVPNDNEVTYGIITYVWYYGIIIAGIIFTYINYFIYKFLEKRKYD